MPESKSVVLKALRNQGWQIEEDNSAFQLPKPIKTRYAVLPEELMQFLSGLKSCTNAGQTAWFLCQDDFTGQTDSDWKWNEFETMLLGWAETEQERNRIIRFWDNHFPFLLSVHTGYAFFAITLMPDELGQVVHGLMEYGIEEVSFIAASFGEFLSLLLAGTFPVEVGIAKQSAT